jgi:hypothetical protein
MRGDSSDVLYSSGDGLGGMEYSVLEKQRSTGRWRNRSAATCEDRAPSLKIVGQVDQ